MSTSHKVEVDTVNERNHEVAVRTACHVSHSDSSSVIWVCRTSNVLLLLASLHI